MKVTTTVQVYGVKETLKELNSIDPVARRQFTKDAGKAAAPIMDAAKAKYPNQYLSGMASNWGIGGVAKFPYTQSKTVKGLSVKVDTRKKSLSVISVIQKDAAASIIDMAGKKGGKDARGEAFIRNLTANAGGPSRVMWPAADGKTAEVEANMLVVIESVMDELNRNLMII
jgi:hypothetical protein